MTITVTAANQSILSAASPGPTVVNTGSFASSSFDLTLNAPGLSLFNSGSLLGANAVSFGGGTAIPGYVYNKVGGLIQGNGSSSAGDGIADGGSANQNNGITLTILNKGSIGGNAGHTGAVYSTGIFGYLNMVLTNFGTISQSVWNDGSTTITNSGQIKGEANYAGIYAENGTISITNLSGGTINANGGNAGIYIKDGSPTTLTNAGYITGASGAKGAVDLGTGGSNLVVLDNGYKFNGKVDGGTGGTNVLELGSAGGAGTLSSFGSEFVDFKTLTIATVANWTLNPTDTLASTTTLQNAGTATVTGLLAPAGVVNNTGTMNVTGTFDPGNSLTNSGVINVTGTFAPTAGTLANSGTIQINGGSVNLSSSAGTSVGGIQFTGTTSTLKLSETLAIGSGSTITGFQANETLVFTGATITSATILTGGTTEQVVFNNGHTITIGLAGSVTPASGNWTNSGGTATLNGTAPCYLAGTLIRTASGEVPVEDLCIGDQIVTLDGSAKPIKWIGRRAYAAAFAAGNRDIIPILIKQGALGDNIPVRDLYVSPLHAMYLDGVLVDADRLVNGESIVRCPDIDPIRYYHIELERHAVIFAEGAPAETFVDCDSRNMFHNAREYADLYPEGTANSWRFCAPRIESGPVLEQIKRAIDTHAGLIAICSTLALGPLQGNFDGLDGNSIAGWAFDPEQPETPVLLEVLDGDGLIARLSANRFRADLESAGIGDGRHGFELRLARSLPPMVRHELRVRRVADGRELSGSPLVIEPYERRSLVRDTRRAIDLAANTAGDKATLDALVETLLGGADQIRRLRATQEQEAGDERLIAPARIGRQRPKRVLVIDDTLPRRDHDSVSNAIFSHMLAFRSLGWDVEFVASGELARGDEAVAALKAWGITCHRAPMVASVEEVLRRKRNMFDLVYLHRLSNAETYAGLVRAWQSDARVLYSVADLHHVRMARQATVQANEELAEKARVMRMREFAAMRMADAIVTHSETEAAIIRAAMPNAPVHVVPWSVPVSGPRVPLRKRQGIAFIGGMRHAPNLDAVRWMAASVMPLVWERDPGMICHLVGPDWSELTLGNLDPRIQLAGVVPNLQDLFDRIRLTVAPLRYGAGIKGKVLDSLAAGVPCAMTPVAAEGIPLDATLRRAVGGDAAEMADLICDIAHRPGLNAKLSKAGIELIRAHYTDDAIRDALEVVVGLGTPRTIRRQGAAAA